MWIWSRNCWVNSVNPAWSLSFRDTPQKNCSLLFKVSLSRLYKIVTFPSLSLSARLPRRSLFTCGEAAQVYGPFFTAWKRITQQPVEWTDRQLQANQGDARPEQSRRGSLGTMASSLFAVKVSGESTERAGEDQLPKELLAPPSSISLSLKSCLGLRDANSCKI